jgi:hypothetical protein
MATLQRNPRDILLDSNPDYQRLAEQHSLYEAKLLELSSDSYLNSELLREEIELKKLKLHCKDEMERIIARVQRSPSH